MQQAVSFRMNEQNVVFSSSGLRLEGLIFRPESRWGASRAAIVCHPHPLYGGSMRNNVVDAILEALWTMGCATLRFNFRGVGGSQGDYDGGPGEAQDTIAAVRFMLGVKGISRDSVILAGYSFGAMVAAEAASSLPEVSTLAAVAPPILGTGPSYLSRSRKRLVIVAGERDMYCPPLALDELRGTVLGPLRLRTVAGGDHFFVEHEAELKATLVEAFQGA
jgi:uncharacterized protein